MATWTWAWYNGATWTNFGNNSTDKIAFYGWNTDVATSYGTMISVSAFNDTMHLRKIADGTDNCATPHMTGVKYTGAGTVSITHAAGANLNTVTQNQSIRVTFADAGMSATANSYLYSYGATTADAPAGVTTYAAEQGDATWTSVTSSATKKTLSNPTGASVAWYVILSAGPSSIGEKNTNFTWRMETDYY